MSSLVTNIWQNKRLLLELELTFLLYLDNTISSTTFHLEPIWTQFAHLQEVPTFEVEKNEQLPASTNLLVHTKASSEANLNYNDAKNEQPLFYFKYKMNKLEK